MTLQRNHYEVLGVPRKATTDEIKKKYRELARKFHPDIAKDKVMGQKIFSQINQAYRILGDPDRRAQYDAALSTDTATRPQSAAANSQNGTAASRPTPPPSAQDTANVTRLVAEAETAMLQNNIGKVKQICESIIKLDARNQKAHGLLGDAFAGMGKRQEAVVSYRQALQIAPSFAIQAKLDRLQGAPARPAVNGAASRPVPPPVPPPNGAAANGVNRTGQNRTDQGRVGKPAGGLFSRLLGKK